MTGEGINAHRYIKMDKAIYILANDKVLEFTKVLFRSLRHFNREIPALIIPFDDNVGALRKEAMRFKINFFEDGHPEELDSLALNYFDEKREGGHMFRKFAAFWGPCETFFYIDSDCVFLDDPEKLFTEFKKADCDFMSFDNDETRAYLPGAFRERMQKNYGTKSFNAGAFISRRGLFNIAKLKLIAQEAQAIKDQFAPRLGDQPFFNFAVDSSRLRQKRLPEINKNYPDKEWADQVPIRFKDGAYRLLNKNSPDYYKPLPFIHYAGYCCDAGKKIPNRHIFRHFQLSGCSFGEKIAYAISCSYKLISASKAGTLSGRVVRKIKRLLGI